MSLLDVRNLSMVFGGVTALDHVSFAMETGKITAVIGPNGAGKTTLFNLITGMYRPSSGEIRYKERLISGLKPNQIAAAGIARTFQNLQVFENMTVVENVMVGCHLRTRSGLLAAAFRLPAAAREQRAARQHAMSMLEKVGLAAMAEEDAGDLAFGQQRLLEIARAMAMSPKLLLLDEPAAGLSGMETRELEQLILQLKSDGTAILLVEHDMETVMTLADHIAVLDFGVKIAEGSPEEIQRNRDVIAAYLGEEDQNA